MNDITYEKYKRAGKIAAGARNLGASLIKPGVRLLDVVSAVEKKILDEGAGIAFPTNIALNDIAAHFSPRHDDTSVFKKGDVVKLDVGAHVDGYIADTAVTIELGTHNYEDMIRASSDALEAAIARIKADVDLGEIGSIVESTITSYGFKPIDNLTGHSLERYTLHSGMSVPSVSSTSETVRPKAGDVIAIEPFATNGMGHVVSGPGSNIYLCNKSIRSRLVRDPRAKAMFQKLTKRFKTLPFAQRWTEQSIPNSEIVLKRLSLLGFIKHYPQLPEAKKGIVTQKEHTVIITEEGCDVTT